MTEALSDADVDGPWEADGSEITTGWDAGHEWVGETCRTDDPEHMTERNSTFIAHARTDVPTLCAEVRRLRAALAAVCSEGVECERCGQ